MQAKRVDIVKIKIVKEGSVLYKSRKIRTAFDAADLFRQFLGEEPDREVFLVMCLDTKNCPTALQLAFTGSLNATIVHPREVMKLAILSNSAAIIVGHNHPSGDPTPSREDIEVTRRLVESGNIIGVDVLDHIVLGEAQSFISLKEKGLL